MRNRILLLAVLPIFAFACSEQKEEAPEAISFAPTVNAETKVSAGHFEANDVIGLFVTQYEGDVAPALQLGGNYASNIPVIFDGHTWTCNPKLYWGEGKLDFYAYYPRMDVNSIEELPFSVALDQSVPAGETTMSAYEASDFLWTRTLGITRMESVPLVFKHKMSKIIVNLQKGIDYEGDLPSDAILLIHNTIPDALIDLSTGDVVKSPRSVTQTIIAQKEADGVYSAIIVPQMLTNRVPLFELICQDVSYLVESKFNFKSGICHSVNFALSDNPERVKISIGGEIDGWN